MDRSGVGFCNSRVDKIRPDGSERTQITDGGGVCTPPGKETIGDADPGWSSDGQTIYSSRGFVMVPAGLPASSLVTERKLYAFSSDRWAPAKPVTNLSLPLEPACVEGVPKDSPDGERIALFRACFDEGAASTPGVYVTDTTGSYRHFVASGFGPDWNPVAGRSCGRIGAPSRGDVDIASVSRATSLPSRTEANPSLRGYRDSSNFSYQKGRIGGSHPRADVQAVSR